MGSGVIIGAQPSIREICSGMQPYERRRFFASDESIKVLGAKIARAEHKRLNAEYRRLSSIVASGAWLDAVDRRSEEFPPGRNEIRTPHGARMVMSVVSGRYTPPQCLSVEDRLDAMSEMEAEFYSHPESISAKVIRDIGAVGAREMGGSWG